MHNDSSRHSDEVGRNAPGSALRVRPPAHPIAAQAVGLDAAQRSWYLPRWLDWLPHLQVEPPEAPPSDEPVTVARLL